MSYGFNVDEIFEMAIQMEVNGGTFYRSAAAATNDSDAKTLLEDLARMEDDHEELFKALRNELSGDLKTQTVFDPEGESALYLRALVDSKVFFEKTVDTSSMKSVLKEAIVAEKDAIVFYLGMKEMVAGEEGKKKIDTIIKEEMGHIRTLTGELSKNN
jgi:rubrerythrin